MQTIFSNLITFELGRHDGLRLRLRFRGDMIETDKILNNVYDKDVVPLLALNNNVKTRGNLLKLSVNRAHLNLEKVLLHI